jgi:hypothetical protein
MPPVPTAVLQDDSAAAAFPGSLGGQQALVAEQPGVVPNPGGILLLLQPL